MGVCTMLIGNREFAGIKSKCKNYTQGKLEVLLNILALDIPRWTFEISPVLDAAPS